MWEFLVGLRSFVAVLPLLLQEGGALLEGVSMCAQAGSKPGSRRRGRMH